MKFFPVLIVLMFLIILSMAARADIYVVSDKESKVVLSLSDANDAVLPSTAQVDVIKGAAGDYLSQASASDYTFTSKKLKLDVAKVNEREQQRAAVKGKADEYAAINKRAMLEAYKLLVADGKKFTYWSEKDFQ